MDDDSPVFNKYSDTMVSEAVSRRDTSQEIHLSHHNHHKNNHQLEIKYNPQIMNRLNEYYGKKNATIKTQKAYQFNLKDQLEEVKP